MALKPRGVTKSSNRGISGPTNGHVSNKILKKKEFAEFSDNSTHLVKTPIRNSLQEIYG